MYPDEWHIVDSRFIPPTDPRFMMENYWDQRCPWINFGDKKRAARQSNQYN